MDESLFCGSGPGIAGIPVLSGAGFRLAMWVIVTLLSAGYMMIYAEKIRKNPAHSVVYESDAYFRGKNGLCFGGGEGIQSGP